MGKTSWGVLGLLFACLVHGAPTLTVATDVWPPFRIAGRERRLPGAGYRHSAPVAGAAALCFPQTGALGTGTQTDADRSGRSHDRAGDHTEERAAFIDYLQPSYYQCRPAFYGKPAAVAASRRYEDLRGREIGYVLNSAYLPPSMATPARQARGPHRRPVAAHGAGPPAPDDRDRLPGGLRPEPAQRGRPLKAPFSPQPGGALPGMSKHSPHQALQQPLALALQAGGRAAR
jgi:polar amino acid transport system substrate-binding protein